MTIPSSLVRLSQQLYTRTLDLSGMGLGIDVCEQRLEPDEFNDANLVGVNGVESINNMPLKVF